MANNQNRFTFGLALMQFLVTLYGTNKTNLTGPQKKEKIVDSLEPIFNLGAQVAEANTNDAMSKAEIGLGVQALHDSLLTAGVIHDTTALNEGTANVAPQQSPVAINVVHTTADVPPNDINAPAPPAPAPPTPSPSA